MAVKITYFKDAFDAKNAHYIDIFKCYDRIKSGASRIKVDIIRSKETKKERDELKVYLPVIVFSGEFKARNNNSCTKQSKRISIDIDKIGSADKVVGLKKKIEKLKWVEACFVSPSGDGLKVIAKLSTENHLGHYLKIESFFEKEFKVKIDKSGKDLSRACFESYDPDIYVNPNAEDFSEVFVVSESTSERVKLEISKPVTDYDKIYDYLKIWAEKKLKWEPGQRHPFLVRMCAGCNKFGIPKEIARGYLLYDFVEGASNFERVEFDKIINHIYTKYESEYNTKAFDEKTTYAYNPSNNQTVYDSEVYDVEDDEELGVRDFIYLKDIWDDCVENFLYGQKIEATTHFKALDEYWKPVKGEVTLIGGHGNHGKTTFMMQVLVNRAVLNNERFAIFSPETYPPVHFYDDLVCIYLGNAVEKQYYHRCTLEQYKEGMEFIKDHFFYLFPMKETPTSGLILKRFEEAKIKHRIDGVAIDPFNQMDREILKQARDDQFISAVLTDFKKFATLNDVYFFIVAHPNSKVGFKEKGDKEYAVPGVYEFAGGAVWNAKVDNILIYHRPDFKKDPKSTRCQCIAEKIKRRTTGTRGTLEMDYVFKKRRFFIGGVNPLEKEYYNKMDEFKAENEGMTTPYKVHNLNMDENGEFWNKKKIEEEKPSPF